MAEPLDVVAERRLAEIALCEAPNVGKVGTGLVLTVVREPGGKIYIGLNTGIPQRLSDVMYKAILAQKARIWQGEVIVVIDNDLQAFGGHAEVTALSPAIRDRERMLGRKLTEKDLQGARVDENDFADLRGKISLAPTNASVAAPNAADDAGHW